MLAGAAELVLQGVFTSDSETSVGLSVRAVLSVDTPPL